MCYYSSHAAKVVNAQAGDVLQVKTQMHGTNWLVLAGTKTVACLKPGTEVEIARVPFLSRWFCRVRLGLKATFQCRRSGERMRRDVFLLPDGQQVLLEQVPHRLQIRVTAVPVPERPRKGSPDLEIRVEELEEDLALV
jgi:hypothetical protein